MKEKIEIPAEIKIQAVEDYLAIRKAAAYNPNEFILRSSANARTKIIFRICISVSWKRLVFCDIISFKQTRSGLKAKHI